MVLSLSKHTSTCFPIKMYFFYLIRCRDNSFYAGVSSDVRRRFAEHKDGKGGRYTRSHKPIEVVYTEQFETQKEALARERQVKIWRREKKEDLIEYGKLSRRGSVAEQGTHKP